LNSPEVDPRTLAFLLYPPSYESLKKFFPIPVLIFSTSYIEVYVLSLSPWNIVLLSSSGGLPIIGSTKKLEVTKFLAFDGVNKDSLGFTISTFTP